MPGGFGDTGYGTGGYGVTQDGSDVHAPWATEMPYADQLDIGWVGPHDTDVEWEGYNPRPTRADADVVVTTTSELYSELGTSGQLIWLDEGTTFNVDTEDGAQNIAQGITLASDGATIQASEVKRPIFYLSDDNVRITGIRFEGEEPNPDLDNPPSGASITSRGIVIQAQGVEIDNCEVYGFTDSGIYVGWNDNSPPQYVEPNIHHTIVRDCLYSGLGYGVVVYSGNPQIGYCFINGCRHGVAAGGRDACEYTFTNNIHGEQTLIFQSEMHEHPDTNESSGIGATLEHNEYRAVERPNGNTARAYAQRGTPQNLTRFDNNWTWNPDGVNPNDPGDSSTALSQTNHGSSSWQNVEWSNNHHGESAPTDSTIGIQELENVAVEAEYSVTIAITDSATAGPIEGASVEIGSETLMTDSAGEVTTMLTAGTHYLSISADGYESTTESITVESESTHTFALTATSGDNTVSFTITDAESGDPISGATIEIEEVL